MFGNTKSVRAWVNFHKQCLSLFNILIGLGGGVWYSHSHPQNVWYSHLIRRVHPSSLPICMGVLTGFLLKSGSNAHRAHGVVVGISCPLNPIMGYVWMVYNNIQVKHKLYHRFIHVYRSFTVLFQTFSSVRLIVIPGLYSNEATHPKFYNFHHFGALAFNTYKKLAPLRVDPKSLGWGQQRVPTRRGRARKPLGIGVGLHPPPSATN